ncbi:MAG TPA: alginate export family protein, partial [Gammaproteobacteria bacterium]|nr:alginate export family protein [Gammaproteobacteria bacterium]
MDRNACFASATYRVGMCLGAMLCGGAATAAQMPGEAFREADFIVDWRVRYESVDQGGFGQTADAATSRLRGGLQTAPYFDTALLAELVWIEDVVGDYNSTTNGQTQYPVVADPSDFAAINRFALINKSLANTTLTIGRQRINLDDTRFVGSVAWRQNEQTFDGLRAEVAGAKLKADLTYANQVNRVFGPDSPVGEWHGDVLLSNVSHTFSLGTLTAFDYLLDLEDAAAVSSNTVGLRLTGSKPVGRFAANYVASIATQADTGRNPADFTEQYYFLEGGLKLKKLTLSLGYEVLTGNGTTAFQTPLATMHAFQGWADKFLTTPAAGIEDRYLKL